MLINILFYLCSVHNTLSLRAKLCCYSWELEKRILRAVFYTFFPLSIYDNDTKAPFILCAALLMVCKVCIHAQFAPWSNSIFAMHSHVSKSLVLSRAKKTLCLRELSHHQTYTRSTFVEMQSVNTGVDLHPGDYLNMYKSISLIICNRIPMQKINMGADFTYIHNLHTVGIAYVQICSNGILSCECALNSHMYAKVIVLLFQVKGKSHITLNPSRRCLTCGAK